MHVLPVHGPGEERVYFEEGAEEEALSNVVSTKLQGFFKLCADNPSLDLSYADAPAHYMWEKDREGRDKFWRRKKDPTDVIRRLAQASPSTSQRSYIRLLLLNRTRATSFEDLRTVNGVVYENFHLACIALGILVDDQAHRRTMAEIESVMTAFQLRRLFARLLAFCDIADCLTLWEEFKDALSADYTFLLCAEGALQGDTSPTDLALAGIGTGSTCMERK